MPDTTYSGTKAYSDEQAVKGGYNPDCYLNNKQLIDSVCKKQCEDKNDATIKSESGITDITYVPTFRALCGPYCPLTDEQRHLICLFKHFGRSKDQMVQLYSKARPREVKDQYRSCQ